MSDFKAYLIEEDGDGKSRGRMTTMTRDALDAGEVVLKVQYSSVNYKDALAATGQGKIIRRFPCVGGIDMAGTVESSSDDAFKPGDAVIATSYDIGVAHHGGYAEVARLPAGWVLPLPRGLSLEEAMALGTAGLTAGLAVARMEQCGLKPGQGPVAVTGATGGVGGLAIDMLAGRGYEVHAFTRKASEKDYLQTLGAAEVRLVDELDLEKIRPLQSGQWAGAVDNVGGPMLAWLLATMQQGGTVASIGNAASHRLETTVFPFILRGVSLLGIDSVQADHALRSTVWQRLGSDLKPRHLAAMTEVIDLDALPSSFDDFIAGRIRGRRVVRIGG